MVFLNFIKRHFGVLLILVIAFSYMTHLSSKESNGNEIPIFVPGNQIVTFENNIEPTIISLRNNDFYSVAGREIKYIKDNGDVEWVQENDLNNPIVSSKGNYIAVREQTDGKNIYVYNRKGIVTNINLNRVILDASVNENGYVALLSAENTGYVAELYNDKGEMVVGEIINTENRYPVSVSVSHDNKVLAVASISTDALRINSNISFISSELEGGVFAGFNLEEGAIVGKIKFSKNNLIVITDKGILINEISNNTILNTYEYTFDSYIDFATTIDDQYFAIVLGTEINNSLYSLGTILFYNFKGELISEYVESRGVTGISPTDNGLIVTSGKTCYSINTKGKELWRYTHNRNFSKAIYIGDKTIGILVENDGISTIERR